jgi:hypothetical protein
MPSPKRKRIPSFIKTGARVTFERPDSYDFNKGTFEAVVVSVHPDEDEPIALSYMEDDDLQAQWASVAHVKRAEGATDAGDDEHLRATREPRARDQWEHATLGTVTVARVEGGMVVAYASSGPAESGGRLSVPVGDWWAFVEGCDLLEVAEDSE